MRNGQKVFFVPGRSKAHMKPAATDRINRFMQSIIEEVTIISLINTTGNAKVKDKRKRIFYVNPLDLTVDL